MPILLQTSSTNIGCKPPDETGNTLTALAKGAWTYAETVSFGAPKLLYGPIESITGFDVREAVQPKGFQERIGVGIGGAAGFLYPMRKLGGYLTKGVARWAPSGINKFSKRFVDDSIEVMKKDKRFAKWLKAKVKSLAPRIKFPVNSNPIIIMICPIGKRYF